MAICFCLGQTPVIESCQGYGRIKRTIAYLLHLEPRIRRHSDSHLCLVPRDSINLENLRYYQANRTFALSTPITFYDFLPYARLNFRGTSTLTNKLAFQPTLFESVSLHPGEFDGAEI